MRITLRLVIDPENGHDATESDIAVFDRHELSTATAGLSLDEAHQALTGVQQRLVAAQAEVALEKAARCGCGRRFAHKDTRELVLRTLFGVVRLPSPRWKTCPCAQTAGTAATFRPLARLLPERTTPELAYWEAKYAALTSYGTAAKLLGETFPLGRDLDATALRRRTARTAQRLEAELGDERMSFIETCPRDLETMPRPDLPLVVGLDGGYVHSSRQTSRRDGWFEVVAGRSQPTGGGKAKYFAYNQTLDDKPKRRLYEVLKSQGMADNQRIEFFTDGGEDIRDVPLLLNPLASHYLDWFHITMRLTVLRGSARGLPETVEHFDPEYDDEPSKDEVDPARVDRYLEKVKHYLWHGNTWQALTWLDMLCMDFEQHAISGEARCTAFAAKLEELRTYIARNRAFIPNYGERHRCGEAVSSSIAEAAVNHVISKRMVKKQQMRWSPEGAHLLLQLRCRVLNDDLAGDFARWYPGFTRAATAEPKALASPASR